MANSKYYVFYMSADCSDPNSPNLACIVDTAESNVHLDTSKYEAILGGRRHGWICDTISFMHHCGWTIVSKDKVIM